MTIGRRDFINGTMASVAVAALFPAARGAAAMPVPDAPPEAVARRTPPAMLLGHDAVTGGEIAHDSYLARQHALVVGDGADRARYLSGLLLTNALAPGAGGMFVTTDPDGTLRARVAAACAAAGRQDDLMVLNFGTDIVLDRDAGVRSHTFNPFAADDGHSLAHLLYRLVAPEFGRGGDSATWSGRTVACLAGPMAALAWKRDQGMLEMTPRTIAGLFNLPALADLRRERGMPTKIADTIGAYLASLPGFDADLNVVDQTKIFEGISQHLFVQRHLVGVLGWLSGYPAIFDTMSPDVVMKEAVLRRRIVLVILPDADDRAQSIIGRLVMASFKGFVGSVMGSSLEVEGDGIADAGPYRAPGPFFVLANDIDRYAVEGMAILASQGRALNMSLIYGTASIPAIMAADDREARSIIANTRTKIFLRRGPEEAVGCYTPEGMAAMVERARKLDLPAVSFSSGPRAGDYARYMELEVATAQMFDLRESKPGEAVAVWDDKWRSIRTDRIT